MKIYFRFFYIGIWASDSDEEDARPSFSRAPKNYSAPVSFVAGGVQQAGQPKEKKESDDEEEENDRIKNSSR